MVESWRKLVNIRPIGQRGRRYYYSSAGDAQHRSSREACLAFCWNQAQGERKVAIKQAGTGGEEEDDIFARRTFAVREVVVG